MSLVAPWGAAWAAVTITPTNFGGNPVVSGVGFYSSTDPNGVKTLDTPGKPFHDPDTSTFTYGVVDVSKTQDTDPTLVNALSFSVNSSLTTFTSPAGQTPVLTILANGIAGTSAKGYVPIAGLNGNNCKFGGCLSIANTGLPVTDGSTLHSYAVAYPAANPTITVGVQIFPKDICADYPKEAGNQQAFGCTSGLVQVGDPLATPVVSGAPLQLTWQIVNIDASGNVQTPVLDQGTLNLQFQSNALPFNCPTDLASRYFPGDGSITFDASEFFVAPNSSFAPQAQLITVGKIQSSPTTPITPIVNASFINVPATDDFFNRGGFSSTETITGFKNTNAAGDNTYTLGFMTRDASGMINPTPATGGTGGICSLSGIQTATVNTFLSQSKCFIATAAFRSVDASPVTMLREFRDRVLLGNELGEAFVRWYYHWSPPAAEWLMRHPQARFPVLEALVPVEIVAWFMLHPMQLTVLLVFSLSGIILGLIFAFVMKAKGRAQQ